MWSESYSKCTEKLFDLSWKTRIRILGVYFYNHQSTSHVKENWSECIANFKRLIFTLEKRNVSITGKICIIKPFLIFQIVYIMQALIVSDRF